MNMYLSSYFVFSFINANINEIYNSIINDNELKVSYYKKEIKDLFSDVDKESNAPKQSYKNDMKAILFTNNTPKGVIQISNISDGWRSLTYVITNLLQTSSYIFNISDDHIPDAMNYLTYINYKNNNLFKRRVVYAMKDPNWKFYQEGEPLWFENTEYYKNKIKKKRINRAILTEYCSKIGLEITEDEFWEIKQKSLLIEIKNS